MNLPILSLWGIIESYPEILEGIDIPTGMDLESLKLMIKMYAGKNECRYPDADELNILMHTWFKIRKSEYQRMWDALQAEYNPIENTDRYEDFWRTFESENSEKSESTVVGETSGNNTRTPELSSEETTSAFDSSSYQPSRKVVDSGHESNSSRSNGTQDAEEKTENSRIDEEKHGLHSHGNIGVTTNQEMITEELELRKFNIYKYIALEIENEFTIPVYERRCYNYVL